ncbi:putative cellular nucleic acid-binding protein [Monocercomonoides exilis]|uniref:putative cellular nucleic acid-binding protein n=1 Tax=Monocercomonoides exilis TaxID=2049356 RepID=UPI003559415E|nr:putative cellular nucleic acid-binding protein [Monocercomonoides exilis]|eukprot:MONOS_4383.1-p1 / transcript=MONOS_4383.1 / gene=MONOS_4383 / organism=Monocercomonoides_exilis_PA203 / gene_product=unspecified product / transcript_product=unspecified product / location=Mono_scaffold00116:32575-37379(-) / protein_length=1500 / sequence_SO=supercontig / SO=protein_coding / is_pseudo=false
MSSETGIKGAKKADIDTYEYKNSDQAQLKDKFSFDKDSGFAIFPPVPEDPLLTFSTSSSSESKSPNQGFSSSKKERKENRNKSTINSNYSLHTSAGIFSFFSKKTGVKNTNSSSFKNKQSNKNEMEKSLTTSGMVEPTIDFVKLQSLIPKPEFSLDNSVHTLTTNEVTAKPNSSPSTNFVKESIQLPIEMNDHLSNDLPDTTINENNPQIILNHEMNTSLFPKNEENFSLASRKLLKARYSLPAIAVSFYNPTTSPPTSTASSLTYSQFTGTSPEYDLSFSGSAVFGESAPSEPAPSSFSLDSSLIPSMDQTEPRLADKLDILAYAPGQQFCMAQQIEIPSSDTSSTSSSSASSTSSTTSSAPSTPSASGMQSPALSLFSQSVSDRRELYSFMSFSQSSSNSSPAASGYLSSHTPDHTSSFSYNSCCSSNDSPSFRSLQYPSDECLICRDCSSSLLDSSFHSLLPKSPSALHSHSGSANEFRKTDSPHNFFPNNSEIEPSQEHSLNIIASDSTASLPDLQLAPTSPVNIDLKLLPEKTAKNEAIKLEKPSLLSDSQIVLDAVQTIAPSAQSSQTEVHQLPALQWNLSKDEKFCQENKTEESSESARKDCKLEKDASLLKARTLSFLSTSSSLPSPDKEKVISNSSSEAHSITPFYSHKQACDLFPPTFSAPDAPIASSLLAPNVTFIIEPLSSSRAEGQNHRTVSILSQAESHAVSEFSSSSLTSSFISSLTSTPASSPSSSSPSSSPSSSSSFAQSTLSQSSAGLSDNTEHTESSEEISPSNASSSSASTTSSSSSSSSSSLFTSCSSLSNKSEKEEVILPPLSTATPFITETFLSYHSQTPAFNDTFALPTEKHQSNTFNSFSSSFSSRSSKFSPSSQSSFATPLLADSFVQHNNTRLPPPSHKAPATPPLHSQSTVLIETTKLKEEEYDPLNDISMAESQIGRSEREGSLNEVKEGGEQIENGLKDSMRIDNDNDNEKSKDNMTIQETEMLYSSFTEDILAPSHPSHPSPSSQNAIVAHPQTEHSSNITQQSSASYATPSLMQPSLTFPVPNRTLTQFNYNESAIHHNSLPAPQPSHPFHDLHYSNTQPIVPFNQTFHQSSSAFQSKTVPPTQPYQAQMLPPSFSAVTSLEKSQIGSVSSTIVSPSATLSRGHSAQLSYPPSFQQAFMPNSQLLVPAPFAPSSSSSFSSSVQNSSVAKDPLEQNIPSNVTQNQPFCMISSAEQPPSFIQQERPICQNITNNTYLDQRLQERNNSFNSSNSISTKLGDVNSQFNRQSSSFNGFCLISTEKALTSSTPQQRSLSQVNTQPQSVFLSPSNSATPQTAPNHSTPSNSDDNSKDDPSHLRKKPFFGYVSDGLPLQLPKLPPKPISPIPIIQSQPSIRCFRCSAVGHSFEDCPFRSKDEVLTRAACYKCGQMGHISRDCPNEDRRVCFLCKKAGHVQKNCPLRVTTPEPVTLPIDEHFVKLKPEDVPLVIPPNKAKQRKERRVKENRMKQATK